MPRFWGPYKDEGGWKRCVMGCIVRQLKWLPWPRGDPDPICLGCFNRHQKNLRFMHQHGYKSPDEYPLHEWADLEPVGANECLI